MASLLVYGRLRSRHSSPDKRRHLDYEPLTLDDLLSRLRHNEIEELKLGWNSSNFVHGRRTCAALERALKQNTSLRRVSIGWRHTHRDSLIRLLRALGNFTSLTHLQLVLDDNVPETVLSHLLQMQRNLVSIDLRAVNVLSLPSESTSSSSSSSPSWRAKRAAPLLNHSVVTNCLHEGYYHHPHLKILSLVECNMTDVTAVSLADFLHIRGGVSELCLRSNRKLTGHGLRVLCQAPVMKRLDLSLCDLESDDVVALAEGVAARPWPVQELLLAGNYRMGSNGLMALIQQGVCQKMASLDISYCDAKDYRAVMILHGLAQLKPTTTLKHIVMHGSSVGNDSVASALYKLLVAKTSLRTIRMSDPGAPKPMNASQLGMVLGGLEENYELERLELDYLRERNEIEVWTKINFLLKLNEAGRRILRSPQSVRRYPGFPVAPPDDWFQVLEKAGDDDLTVLYWIIRQSTDHLLGSLK